MKGTALAYDLYANPVWRLRCDTDLLLMPEDAEECREVLAALGFRKDVGTSREAVIHDETWTLASRGGGSHAIDLQRRLNNSDLLANLFSYEAFLGAKRPTPGLGPSAGSAWRKLDYLFALAVPRREEAAVSGCSWI
jgi:hypothetical protein